MLLYIGAAVTVLLGSGTGFGFAIGNTLEAADRIEAVSRVFVAVGGAFAGYQIAQEKKIGWYLGIAVAALPLVAKVIAILRSRLEIGDLFGNSYLINTMFEIALLALILHVQSRKYVKIWFK